MNGGDYHDSLRRRASREATLGMRRWHRSQERSDCLGYTPLGRPRPGGVEMRGILIFFLLLSTMAVSEAQMYQWVNPRTGTVQLSGAPPSWYRGAQEGPRVLVFDQGRVVDDTAISVPARRRRELREAAFQAAIDRQRLKALQQLEQVAKEDDRGEPVERLERREGTDAAPLSRATINQLKAIIAGWDQRRTATGDGSETVDAEQLKAIIADWDKREAGSITR